MACPLTFAPCAVESTLAELGRRVQFWQPYQVAVVSLARRYRATASVASEPRTSPGAAPTSGPRPGKYQDSRPACLPRPGQPDAPDPRPGRTRPPRCTGEYRAAAAAALQRPPVQRGARPIARAWSSWWP